MHKTTKKEEEKEPSLPMKILLVALLFVFAMGGVQVIKGIWHVGHATYDQWQKVDELEKDIEAQKRYNDELEDAFIKTRCEVWRLDGKASKDGFSNYAYYCSDSSDSK